MRTDAARTALLIENHYTPRSGTVSIDPLTDVADRVSCDAATQ